VWAGGFAASPFVLCTTGLTEFEKWNLNNANGKRKRDAFPCFSFAGGESAFAFACFDRFYV
jgi:hypothetical protein